MENPAQRELFQQARNTLKGEDDAVFMYGATRPDARAMEALSPEEADEVRRLQDQLLEDTERHSKFLKEMVERAEGTEGAPCPVPDRMRLLSQFAGLFQTESRMLVEHLELFQKYLKNRGLDDWARGLQSIIRDEFAHVKMTHRLLSLAVLSEPDN